MSRKGGEFDNISDEWEELTPVQFAQCHAYIQERWPETVDEAEYQKRLHHLQQKHKKGKHRMSRSYVVKPAGSFVEIEDGGYNAVVDRIEEIETTYGDAFKFIFRVDTGEEEVELSALVNAVENLTPKTKLFQWASAILGELKEGQAFDTDMLIDKPCRVLVANETNENGTWAKIKNVSARKGKKTTRVENTEF